MLEDIRIMSNDVCVVIPIYKQHLDANEQLSIDRCRKLLCRYAIIFVGPELFAKDRPHYLLSDDELKVFPSSHFHSLQSYNKLLLTEDFWSEFDFRYMLLYQPDSLVFKDELMMWVEKGFSFVGSPWLISKNKKMQLADVGNGGFSLRDIHAHTKVIQSRYVRIRRVRTYKGLRHLHIAIFLITAFVLFKCGIRLTWAALLAKYGGIHEDVFWGIYAQNFYEGYRPADVHTALQFAFDCFPEQCFELTNRNMPFGCHGIQAMAWALSAQLDSPEAC